MKRQETPPVHEHMAARTEDIEVTEWDRLSRDIYLKCLEQLPAIFIRPLLPTGNCFSLTTIYSSPTVPKRSILADPESSARRLCSKAPERVEAHLAN
jgi:hypothetical protein